MAEVIEVRPEGIMVLIKHPLEELILLKKGLEKTDLQLDLKNPEDVKIQEYMTENLYPMVAKLVEDLKQ